MKLGGAPIRHEPTNVVVIYENAWALGIFEQVGWMAYFYRLQGFDTNISIEFSQGLSGYVTKVRGIDVPLIEVATERVMRLPIEGELWFNHQVEYTSLKDEFIQGTNEQL